MTDRRATSLDEFRKQNWEAFAELESSFEKELSSVSRRLPPRFYHSIRKGLSTAIGPSMQLLSGGKSAPTFRFTVVIDTNIVVQDALNVARGFQSTTARILSSPFVQVIAPSEVWEESERIIRERARKRRLPLAAALKQREALLGRIRRVDAEESSHIRRARQLIGSHSPEDIPFLAVAIETGAAAVVSRDAAAFDRQPVVERWTLHRLVDSVVTFESGALSIVVAGGTASILIRLLQAVVVSILAAIAQAIDAVLRALSALVRGAIRAISSVPTWGWLLVAAALIGVGVYAASHPEMRDRAAEGLAILGAGIAAAARALIEIGTAVLGAIFDLLVWLWDEFLPLTASGVIAAGVLLRRIRALLAEAEQLGRSLPTA